jgi:hypothetical protein
MKCALRSPRGDGSKNDRSGLGVVSEKEIPMIAQVATRNDSFAGDALTRMVDDAKPFAAQLFEPMLPRIRFLANYAFRMLAKEREELVAEVLAQAYVALVRLVDRGRAALAYATALARFSIRQVWVGRRVDARQNSNDVLSPTRPAGWRRGHPALTKPIALIR